MARRITEERLTKTLLNWLEENQWTIICFDFPQSGTGVLLHPNTQDYPHKNKGSFIPDIVAIKNKKAIFFENKDRFVLKDYEKVNHLRTTNIYSIAIQKLLKGFSYHHIYYGVALPQNRSTISNTLKNSYLIDFCIMVTPKLKIQINYDPANIF